MEIYFAVLNFVLAGVIGTIGIATLMKVSTPNEVLFASLPLLFALHQFTEGFVWLGMAGAIGERGTKIAAGIFVYYAQGVLPFLVPLSIWLLEKKGYRKKLLALLMLLGAGLAVYIMYGLATVPTSVSVVNNTLDYYNPWSANLPVALIYILTTCGSLMLSSSFAVVLFGFLNLIGLIIIYLVRPYGFTSLWCLYATAISGLLYFHFVKRRIAFLKELQESQKHFSKKLAKELSSLQKRRFLHQSKTGAM